MRQCLSYIASFRPQALLCALLCLACSNGMGAKPPAVQPGSSGGEKAAAAPAPKAPAPAAPAFTSFPAVDTAVLGPEEKKAFERIVNEEICPCDCPKSFAGCLQEGTKCRPAVLLADWLVAQLSDGVPAEALAEALTKEIAGGFSSKPKEPVTAGYATKGSATAKWTLVEYADFECGHCKAASAQVEELVRKRPDVRVVFKHFPLSFHPMARNAAIAAEAAGRQGKFWEMHDAIFATQEMLDDDLLLGHAKAIGLDVEKFKKDLKDPAVIAKVEDSRTEGQAFGIQATPMFLVNGRPYYLSRNVEGFELRFAMEEARATSSCQ